MIDAAYQTVSLIQEITKNPVELNYSTMSSRFMIALTIRTPISKIKDVIYIFVHNVLRKRTRDDQVKVLVATGQKITWQGEKTDVHKYIVKPAVAAMIGKNRNKPEQYAEYEERELSG